MRIAIVEPYFSGSHAQWARGFARYSQHQVELFTLPGAHWKWRMRGGAVSLAKRFPNDFDVVIATSMLDFAAFIALSRIDRARTRCVLFMHENQLTYPQPPGQIDHHYAYTNFTSMLSADEVWFNSRFHRDSLLEALPIFLRNFPDHREVESARQLAGKCVAVGLGVDLAALDVESPQTPNSTPLLLWNHRWEYDKNPDDFFAALRILESENATYNVAILGQPRVHSPEIFMRAKDEFSHRIVHWGYVEDRNAYARWLHRADILPVTAIQEFFGVAVIEALYCNTFPLMPQRLVYPEHVPPAFTTSMLYDGPEALAKALLSLVSSWPQKLPSLRTTAAQWDWQRIAPRYDERLTQLCE